MRISLAAPWALAAAIAAPAAAAPLNVRDTLTTAAFVTRDKVAALQQVQQAEAAANAMLARNPNDRDAKIYRAMATGYRAKLTKSRVAALEAHRQFDAFAAANPRDPQALALAGAWHLDAVATLGGMTARLALGAKKADGLAEMDRAVALNRDQASIPAFAALFRLGIDPADPDARALAEAALKLPAPTALDRIMQRSAAAVLAQLRAGNTKAAAAAARQLLPFGRLAS